MKVIGITGGVGAGKSEILKLLEDMCKCVVIRADELAKSLEKKGEVCYEPLLELLGTDIIDDTTLEIIPSKMAAKIFEYSDNNILEKVNGIIHPEVKKRILELIDYEKQKGINDYFFIEAALLIEDHYDVICDEFWYVYSTEEVRIKRLKETRGYSEEKIRNIFASQLDDNDFRKACRHIIDNSNTLEESKKQLSKLLNE